MISPPIKTVTCVFHALVMLSAFAAFASAAHGQSSLRLDADRVRFGGIVEQLSRQEVAGEREEDRRRSSEASAYERSSLRQRDRLAEPEEAVALRPTPMSVQRTSYETVERGVQAERFRPATSSPLSSEVESLQSETHANDLRSASFIERERETEGGAERENVSDIVTRIGVNLVFVLAIAFAGILLFRQVQRGKGREKTRVPDALKELAVEQVLNLNRGASLYVVDGFSSKVLVAVDSGGIKSVDILHRSFEDALEQAPAFSSPAEEQNKLPPEATRQTTRRERRARAQQVERINQEEPTPELDEKLIKMLLSNSRKAA